MLRMAVLGLDVDARVSTKAAFLTELAFSLRIVLQPLTLFPLSTAFETDLPTVVEIEEICEVTDLTDFLFQDDKVSIN